MAEESAPHRSRIPARLVTVGCFVLCATMLAVFLVECRPYLWFRYDLDPGDGDVINNAARILGGLPTYGDWSKGELFGLYTPLYYYYLALSRTLGVDIMVFSRMSNAVFVILSFVLAAAIVKRATSFSSHSVLFLTVAMWMMFRRAAPMYNNIHGAPFLFVGVRPDPLCFMLEMAACYLVCFHRERAWLVAAVAALCPFAKQPGIVVPAVFFLYYLAFHREHLMSFAVTLIVVGSALAIPLEIQNSGQFILSTFIRPSVAIGAKPNWEYVAVLLGIYYMTWRSYLMAACGLLGLYLVVRRRLDVRPLAFLFIADALMFLKLGQNDGAGSAYLWLHWTLLAIFAGVGLAQVLDGPQAWLRTQRRTFDPSGYATAGASVLALVLLSLTIPLGSVVAESRRETDRYAELEAMGERHEAVLAAIARERPGRWGKWYSERQSAALVQAGQILDHEAGTLQQADLAGLVDRKAVIAQFVAGKYPFVQRTWMAEIPMLSAVFDACYRVRAQSYMPDRGHARLVEILEYAGPYGSCQFDQN